MFTVFSFIKRQRFLEYDDLSFNAEVGGNDYSMVNNTAFGQLMGKKQSYVNSSTYGSPPLT
jgi:hypothetical protein